MPEIHYPPGSSSEPVNIRNHFCGFIPMGGIEMPSTLPTLTWNFGAAQALANPLLPSDFIDAVKAAIAGGSWQLLDEDDGTWGGGTDRAILIAPPGSSPTADIRIVIAISSAKTIDAAAVGGNISNVIAQPYITLSPDAGATGFDSFGAGATDVSAGGFFNGGGQAAFKGHRETGFEAFHRPVTTTGMDSITLWETEENILLIPIRNNTNRTAFAGATIVPPSDDAAEADGRVYGLHTSHLDGLNVNLHSNDVTFPAHFAGVVEAKSLIFDPPTLVITTSVKFKTSTVSTALSLTSSGPQAAWSIPLNKNANPFNLLGWPRQIGVYRDGTHGDPITDKDGAAVGIVMSRSSVANNDALAVTNVGNQGSEN